MGVAVGGLGWWASHSPLFRLREVTVTGTAHLSPADVIGLAGIEATTNVLWLDEGAAGARIERDPWVGEAAVARELPGTVRIEVVERVPVGAVPAGGSAFLLVAGDGMVLERVTEDPGLPLIETDAEPRVGRIAGPLVGQALALSELDPGLSSRVRRAILLPDGSLVLRLTGGLRVDYGAPVELETKAIALAEVLAWADGEGVLLGSVDLRAPRAPAAKLRGAETSTG
ncbi:MAG: FtsQ-type POTRA domain-containing protein [Actinobacteria bacterium]|nr:FtsQ-type POTRA domain-containing protein [Actinomycetota bacterium]